MKVLVLHTKYKIKGGEDTVVANESALLRSIDVKVDNLTFNNSTNTILNLLLLPFNVISYFKTRQKLRQYNPDVVHIHNIHFAASPSVLYAIKHAGVPMVFTLHNYRLLCPSATLFFKGKLFLNSVNQIFPLTAIRQGVYQQSKPLTAWLGVNMLLHHWLGTFKMCNRFIVLNDHAKMLFTQSKLRWMRDRLTVKPNFCYQPNTQNSGAAAYFLYIGRLSEEKGIAMLLECFATNQLPLKLVGDGPLKEEVLKYAAAYSNITYLQAVDKQEVNKLLADCTALVFTSQWFETFGMVIIEAFATGTPVIASNIGGIEKLVSDKYNGLHFKPGSVQQLNAALHTWISLPPGLQREYGKNAKLTYNQNFTPETNAAQLLSVYEDVQDLDPNASKNKKLYVNLKHTQA